MSLWVVRILFLVLCTVAGYAVSQVQPQLIEKWSYGVAVGFGMGGLLIAIDEMLKGFSLRAFSAATFGLMLGSLIAWMIDRSGLFVYVEETPTRWLIRLCLFLSFSYIGMILAMRSNKEDFSLIIPYVRFASQQAPVSLVVLDTSVIIDGRVAEVLESNLIEGTVVIPRFVLKELQDIADSSDATRRARGRRGLEILSRIRKLSRPEIKIHDGDFPEESTVDAKLIKLCHAIGAKLFTNDFNLGKVAELQAVPHLNLNTLASALKPVLLPGETLSLKIVREGKDKGQGIGYMNDGTMVVVNHAAALVGQSINVQVQSLLQTGAGVIVFAELQGG
jgi:uncharacterized protein YacL